MEQKYLPIGSVCTLKGKNKKVMITGYYSVEFNGNLRIKDYCGCVYPEGMLLPEQSCTFNHTDIESIDFIGLKNDEYQTFKNLLDRLTGNDLSDEEKAIQFHKENDMFLTSNSTYSKLLFDENGVVMIADPVVEKTIEENKNNYEFDNNGNVISVINQNDIKNPFYKEYSESIIEENDDWKIFNNVEFDENGTVISVDSKMLSENKKSLNKIEFDENGVVISINGDTLKEQIPNYEFDENGTLISIGDKKLEDEIPAIGPGLPGYVEPKKESKYEFDENGTLISVGEEKLEEEIPAIGPGLPGYVEPKKESKYEFDENGTLISVGEEKLEEEIPAIGPGLPGYVEPKKESKYEFDENGTVVESN